MNKYLVLFLAIGLIVAAIFLMEKQKGQGSFFSVSKRVVFESLPSQKYTKASEERIATKERTFERARDLIVRDGSINTELFHLTELIGKKVILLDFWTYSCINCLRSLPYVKAWYEKYKDEGFEVVGVHAPEFEFEKKRDHVAAAVLKWGLTYPVVLDNEHDNMRRYNTVYWPTEILIDIDGFIVYKNIGEGRHRETELKIQELLDERKVVLGGEQMLRERIAVRPKSAADVHFASIGTPEIYLGSRMSRGNFGNKEGFKPGETFAYKLPASFKNNNVYIEGLWYNGSDYFELKSAQGKIILFFKAKTVNMVAGAFKESVRIKVKLDNRPIGEQSCGSDVATIGVAHVQRFDLYNLVSCGGYGRHKLEIEAEGEGLAVYALTFG